MEAMLMPLLSRLWQLPLFEGLDGPALSRIAAGIHETTVRNAMAICRAGDSCHGLYIVVEGQVKLSLQTSQGGEKVIELIGPGQIFGESAMFLDRPHVVAAEALTDCRLAHLAKATVLAELEQTPEFTRSIIHSLSRQLVYLISELERCTLHSGTERVIGYLLNHVPDGLTGQNAMITLPAKKGIIASQLSLTHEHFSRILHELALCGLIGVDGRSVRITDVGRLRTYAAK